MYLTVNLQGVTGFNVNASSTLDFHLIPSVLSATRNASPTFPLLPKNSTSQSELMQRNGTPFDAKNRERIIHSSSKLPAILTTMTLSENLTHSSNISVLSTPIDHDYGLWQDNPYAKRGLKKLKDKEKTGHWGRRFFRWGHRNFTKNLNCTTVHNSNTETTEVMSKAETALAFGLSLALVPIIIVLFCGLNSVFKSIRLRAKKMKRKVMPTI